MRADLDMLLLKTFSKGDKSMTKKSTRNMQYSETEPVLFLAFELSNKDWKLGFSTGFGQKARRRAMLAGDMRKLGAEIAAAKKRFGLSQSTRVVSCYEAGRDGFWLHRYLLRAGIDNLVVDSSSIEVNRMARRVKSDKLDVQKLLTMLMRYHFGEHKVWSVVHPPSPLEEDRRQIHRELAALKKDKTRTTNRIKGLLASQGIQLDEMDLCNQRLDAIRLWDRSALLPALKSRLKREWEHVLFLKQQIATLEAERRRVLQESTEPDVAKMKQLSMLCAIGPCSSWVTVREFFGWRKFKNRREVASLAGLTPTPYQSGETSREQGISKSGNRHMRALAIELAWSWLRYQPGSKLSLWFMDRFDNAGKRARKVGIVALARRLLIDLWRFLEYGVIPEGAQLKVRA
jgi:transposase